eukprot:2356794-Prymnesium_polylepis.1
MLARPHGRDTHIADKRQGKGGWVLLLKLAGDTRGFTLARHASVLLWHGNTKLKLLLQREPQSETKLT